MSRLSRTDIMLYALALGYNNYEAEDFMYELSPECETVPFAIVHAHIEPLFLSDPHGKV